MKSHNKVFTKNAIHYTYSKMNHTLQILDIPIHMSLGCSLEEQSQQQKVLVSVTFNYKNHTEAEKSDQLKDAICYATVAEYIESICQEKSYHLIEHASYQIYTKLKERYPNTPLKLKFHKVNPPHKLLVGGTVYTIGDETL